MQQAIKRIVRNLMRSVEKLLFGRRQSGANASLEKCSGTESTRYGAFTSMLVGGRAPRRTISDRVECGREWSTRTTGTCEQRVCRCVCVCEKYSFDVTARMNAINACYDFCEPHQYPSV